MQDDFIEEVADIKLKNCMLLDQIEIAEEVNTKMKEKDQDLKQKTKKLQHEAKVRVKEEEWMRKQEEYEEEAQRLEVLLKRKIDLDVV